MKIKTGEVTSNLDFMEQGFFYVRTAEIEQPFKVNYCTPYYAGAQGGFVAIPEVGVKVLVCQTEDEDGWYYLGSVMGFGTGSNYNTPDNKLKDKGVLPDKKLYRARQVPQRYIWKTPKGSHILFSEEYNPEFFNVKVELKSPSGKTLKLIDSPDTDCVILENEHGDRIKISSKGNSATAPRSIEVETKGIVNIISRESSINLNVIDGREINIVNTSTGAKRSGSNDSSPGNINIKSENGDVNLTVEGDSGAIFLDAKGSNGHIVLRSAGEIDIEADKDIKISSGGNVVVQGQEIHLN